MSNTSSLKDLQSEHTAHVSHFGALKAATTIPVLKANFPGTALNTDIWNEITANSASLTVDNGLATLSSGTNSAGSEKLISVKQGRFEAGQITVFQSGVNAGAGIADNKRKWGMITADEQDGLYFQWNGTTFQIVSLKGGSETTVDVDNFNKDTTFEPSDANNTYRIE